MRTIVLMTAILAATGMPCKAATVFVDAAANYWQDSGLDVVAGQDLTVEALGDVWYSVVAYVNADGVGNFHDGTVIGGDLSASAVIYSLVGKVGGTDALGTGTLLPEGVLGKGAGFVGSMYNQTVPVSGRLYFGFNDSQPFFDNHGSFEVRFAVPEPSSIFLAGTGVFALLLQMSVRKRAERLGKNRI